MKLNSSKQHLFSQVPEANIPRSVFNRSHSYKTTFSAGLLIPFFADEALPGDTFSVNATLFARMCTPVAPIIDNLHLEVFYFAVPLRLLWDNFKKFMGEQVNPGDSTSYTVPQIVSPVGGWQVETLSDYFGLPLFAGGLSVASFHHRAYNKIYNSWFRDENLINSVVERTGDGGDLHADYNVMRRGKRHDYFTSCLPWPQKGTAVSIPLGTTAPIKYGTHFAGAGAQDGKFFVADTGVGPVSNYAWGTLVDSYDATVSAGERSNLFTDLSTATAATINSLRQAFQLQKLLERDARGGSRYTEIVRAHFGVVSPDARMQRPEFLGGSSAPVVITPIPQTSSTTGSYAQGHLAGYGTSVSARSGFTKSFTEHCVLLGILNVRADLSYQQGLSRMFSRVTKYDFYWPALANIGEQSVLNKEIYAVGTAAPGDAGDLQNNAVFGYQERYAEYRYKPSQITGKLRSTYGTPLDVWHLSQKFTSLPTLNATFISDTPPMSRIKAVVDEPDFLLDSFIDMRCTRPMPVYSVPGLIDHF